MSGGSLLLLNPNSSTASTERMLAAARRALPGFSLRGRTLAAAPPLLASAADLRHAEQALAALPDSTFAGVDAVLLAAFGDPGLVALRARLDVPVFALGESAIRAAAALGRFAIVTITPQLETAIAQQVDGYGAAANYLGLRLTEGDPQRLLASATALREALATLIARTLAEAPLAALVVGGGPLTDAAQSLAPGCPVPLIDPLTAACECIAQAFAARNARL